MTEKRQSTLVVPARIHNTARSSLLLLLLSLAYNLKSQSLTTYNEQVSTETDSTESVSEPVSVPAPEKGVLYVSKGTHLIGAEAISGAEIIYQKQKKAERKQAARPARKKASDSVAKAAPKKPDAPIITTFVKGSSHKELTAGSEHSYPCTLTVRNGSKAGMTVYKPVSLNPGGDTYQPAHTTYTVNRPKGPCCTDRESIRPPPRTLS